MTGFDNRLAGFVAYEQAEVRSRQTTACTIGQTMIAVITLLLLLIVVVRDGCSHSLDEPYVCESCRERIIRPPAARRVKVRVYSIACIVEKDVDSFRYRSFQCFVFRHHFVVERVIEFEHVSWPTIFLICSIHSNLTRSLASSDGK